MSVLVSVTLLNAVTVKCRYKEDLFHILAVCRWRASQLTEEQRGEEQTDSQAGRRAAPPRQTDKLGRRDPASRAAAAPAATSHTRPSGSPASRANRARFSLWQRGR